MSDKYIVRDILYPLVEKSFSDKTNIKKLKDFVKYYTDSRSNILLSLDFSEKLLMNDKEKETFMGHAGLDPKTIDGAIKKSKYIDSNWKRSTSPLAISSIMIASYASINKDPELYAVSLMFLSYQMYQSAHSNTFKKFTPPKEVVEYSMSRLSNRHFIKKAGSIYGALELTVMGSYTDKYEKDFLDVSDEVLTKLISGLKDRISSMVYKIGDIIHDDYRNRRAIFSQKDDNSEENYKVADNISYAIKRLTTLTFNNIISGSYDKRGSVAMACKLNAGCSENKMMQMMNIIVKKDKPGLMNNIQDILTAYAYSEKEQARAQDFGTRKFLAHSLNIYSSNAQGRVTKIKEQLAKWMELVKREAGPNYVSASRSSMDAYKKCIFTFIVLTIMESTK